MISIIITTFKEPRTLPKAIKAFLEDEIEEEKEILVVGPDEETEKITKDFSKIYPFIYYLKDEGKGKPSALNLAFQAAKGDWLILSDGDVFIKKGALKEIIKYFKDSKIGAVSGQPIPLNSRENLFGYFAHFLTNSAHFLRLEKSRKKQFFPCSGYLYAIRNIIKEIPENILAEDAFISQIFWQKGYKIAYAPKAMVFVKFPQNLHDWLIQKKRATGGQVQKIKAYDLKIKTRSFWQEIFQGVKFFFIYPKNLKEFFWTFLLYFLRIYLWFLIYLDLFFKKKSFEKIWLRVESTK